MKPGATRRLHHQLVRPAGRAARADGSMAKYDRNAGKRWTRADEAKLEQLARENTPTRVIGLKLGRTEAGVRAKAQDFGVSLKPTNQSPYNRR